MNRMLPIFLFITLFLTAIVEVIQASDKICDIHGPQSAAGFPRFSASATLVLVAMIGLMTLSVRRRHSPATPVELPSRSDPNALQLLCDAYTKGDLPVMQLCERLAALLRCRLTEADHRPLTSAEVIASARLTTPGDTIDIAAALLDFCDRVRYGAALPDQSAVLHACDQARLILTRLEDE